MNNAARYEKVRAVLDQVPVGITITELVYNYTLVVLTRLEGNRTQTARELRIAIRTLRTKLHEMRVLNYEVVPPKLGVPNNIKEAINE